jgi:Uma2 family endonuclease
MVISSSLAFLVKNLLQIGTIGNGCKLEHWSSTKSVNFFQDDTLTRNDYEPDICFWHAEKSKLSKPNQMQFPSPDLDVETLSDSTEKIDRGIKFEDYAQHGIKEYWIIDAEKQLVEQYVLEGNNYLLKHRAHNHEIIFGQVLQGFNIPALAIFNNDENVRALRELLKP